jgi:hypothetical protein
MMSDETITSSINDGSQELTSGPCEAGAFTTPEFGKALNDADILLGHAASNGQLPATTAGETVRDIVLARHAWQSRHVNAHVAIAFWIAYANLARVTRPVTAASLRACESASLLAAKLSAVLLVVTIIAFSIFLFMNNTTANDAADLIEQQNAAALKLWSNLQVLQSNAEQPAGPSRQSSSALENQSSTAFASRVFEDAVEFSRKSQWLLQSASKLHYWFNPWWTNIDVGPVTFDDHNPQGITHLLISPDISGADQIKAEVVNQIKAYQLIRNYALALDKTDSIVYGGITTYLLPTVYALLGAFLYGFRLYSRLIRRKTYLPSAAHSARFFIAAIAGLVVGLFGSLLPKNLALSPLAVAFLVGYAVEAFFSRIDDLIARFKSAGPAERASAQEEHSGD